jgi:hypothetical protein
LPSQYQAFIFLVWFLPTFHIFRHSLQLDAALAPHAIPTQWFFPDHKSVLGCFIHLFAISLYLFSINFFSPATEAKKIAGVWAIAPKILWNCSQERHVRPSVPHFSCDILRFANHALSKTFAYSAL